MAEEQKKSPPEIAKKRDKEGQQPPYTPAEAEWITFLDKRLEDELFESRKEVGYNRVNIENIWSAANRAYEPRRLRTKRRKHLVQNELTGLRSNLVRLGAEDDWQSDKSKPNPYIKIQTALSILVEANPEGVFIPGLSKYEQTTLLTKNLYKQSWTRASKQQLKVGIFNLAKYGFMCMRTYPLRIAKPVQDLVRFNSDNPLESEYEDREYVEFDGIWRESLPPQHVWIDDLAKPGDYLHVRDWAFYKKYSFEQFDREFGKYPYAKYVLSQSLPEEEGGKSDQGTEQRKQLKDVGTVDMYFYENKDFDALSVRANNVWVAPKMPLPTLHKQLSGWWTHWTLRDDATIYGIGIFEAIRYDHALLDQIRNMTIDQIVLLIYKFFLYSGTNQADSTGTIRVTPGMGKQVADVNNMKWVDVPGVGAEPFKLMEKVEQDIDDASAVSKPVAGQELGKTAFELKVIRDASLQRLKTPLENISDALSYDAILTIKLNEQILSVPEVLRLTDPEDIKAYMDEIKGNEELYEAYSTPNAATGQDEFVFNVRLPKEVRLSLETDDKGSLVESKEERFFRIVPSKLRWEGIVNIMPQSVLAPSKELDKQMKLELFNLVMPLIQPTVGMDPIMTSQYLDKMLKPVKNILRTYEEDVNDWLPDSWLNPPDLAQAAQDASIAPEMPQEPPVEGGDTSSLFVPEGAASAAGIAPQPLAESPRLAGRDVATAERPGIIQRMGNAFNALRGI